MGQGPRIIAHLCNDAGGWGRGFVLALSKRWKEPERAFRDWARQGVWQGEPYGLGGAQMVEVAAQLWVANLVAQRGIRSQEGVPPIRYGALETCLDKLQGFARPRAASLHLPRIGCGLAGGSWERVEPLLRKMLAGLEVFVYDF